MKAGEIGELKRLEGSRDNIFDWGTHYVDMFGFYNGETPAEWVMGQIDYLDVDWSKEYYGAPVENHGVFLWKYKNGVFGFFGSGASRLAIGADNRLIGTEGIIEAGVIDGPIIRIKNDRSSKWEILDTNDEDLHGYINPNIQSSTIFFKRAISDVVDALLTKREPILSAKNALSIKIKKSVFIYLYPTKNGFTISGYQQGSKKWGKLIAVKSSSDLTEALSLTKQAYNVLLSLRHIK